MIYVFSETLLKLFADFFLNSIPFNLDFFLLQMTRRYDFYSKREEERIFHPSSKENLWGEFWRNNRWNFCFLVRMHLEELNS